MSVGRAVLRIRLQRGLTQAQVGRKAGVAPTYLSRIENGHVEPTTGTLGRLAGALDVAAGSFFEAPAPERAADEPRCPASASGRCIGEQIRSTHGRPPRRGEARYGTAELRMLRMADYVVLHGPPEVRRALGVMLEALVERSRGGVQDVGR